MIRKMRNSDLDRICEIEKEIFASPWNKEQFKYELNENPYANLWVVEVDNKIVAYYDLWIIFERAEIATIGVCKEYQGKGFGSFMMEHLTNKAKEKYCETISLEVRVSNQQALTLYNKYDFSIINIKPGYYKENGKYEDAYYMMKGI